MTQPCKVFWPLLLLGLISSSGGTFAAAQMRLPTGQETPVNKTPVSYDIALIGDLPYNARQELQFQTLRQEINQANVEFVIHDGDFKGGATPCTDANFQKILGEFNQFRAPFIFIPGDNEWTDCHRTGSDPLERLAKLRSLFFATHTSLGQKTLPLERQSESADFADYRENVRWMYGQVLYVGLHIVGSNNNLGRTPAADQEYQARNAANLDWLKSSFAIAQRQQMKGVMVVIQANPGFELSPPERTGFNDFLTRLRQEVIAFSKPVVLVHGDSHNFQINKPLFDERNNRLMNFTRLETFGSPDAHWVKASIQPDDPNVFHFKPMIIPANVNR